MNKNKEVGNANYLWISYFYSYLNDHGRAGFVMASSATDSQGKDKEIREQLVRTGHVDVMISVANNFFYTKSLPCSLWFFDKAKGEAIRDKVLFIDARNYYAVVDRTLNEWSEWQLQNMNAIVWLHRGETEKYKALMDKYYDTIHTLLTEYIEAFRAITDNSDPIYGELNQAVALYAEKVESVSTLTDTFSVRPLVEAIYREWKKLTDAIVDDSTLFTRISSNLVLKQYGYKNIRDFKKRQTAIIEQSESAVNQTLTIIDEAAWLYEKFGEGFYSDIPGLCKAATMAEIEEKGWSLTPGAYVGVAPTEDDGVDFATRMAEIHQELLTLQAESNALMDTISRNMKEMGL